MIGSNLLDAIPCDVKAENISNCNKAGYISVVGSKRGINSASLPRRIVLLSSSTLASVKSINVNEKLAQIIVPASGNVKCSHLVSLPREPERSGKY